MNKFLLSPLKIFLLLFVCSLCVPHQVQAESFRPPAVPLVTFDPYLSVWSEADHLTDRNTVHWTHREQSLVSLIRVDGKTYRLMGVEPKDAPALPQISVQVTPTRSLYEFAGAGVHVTLTFMTPALPHDLDVLARPLNYITWTVCSADGASHAVSLYDSASSELTVNQPDEQVEWWREKAGDLTALKMGTQAQPILGSEGDDHRIDWGYLYLSAPADQSQAAMGADQTLVSDFAETGRLPEQDDTRMPRAVSDAQPVLAFVFNLGEVGTRPVSRHVIVAYDEIYAIKYFGQNLRPYWRRNGATAAELLQAAERDYSDLEERCRRFDRELVDDLTAVGGAQYAQICALAYRQCLAACGLAADANGQPLLFTKENTSNGDISTVDVIYPMEPIWILLNPTLAKASLVPVLDYAASPHWKFPNAPHDLGTYPIVFGRDDGGEGMPVEESGNMILLCDAIAHADGNADFVKPWWPQLTQWAEYLRNYGLDPENQLCTDDFMGHLAHNANLSVKAILALAAYGDLCRMRGDEVEAAKYEALAKADARHWMKVASDGDHYRLAFDKPGTWSQEYNLVWNRILGLNVFPPEVAHDQVAFYKSVMQPFGLPLDSRTRLTKTDWSFWSATLADNPTDFEAFIAPIYDYLTRTTLRVPLMDSYETDRLGGNPNPLFRARPVVGGLFIKTLTDRAIWKKWSRVDRQRVGNWAPLPKSPAITVIVPAADTQPALWSYTIQQPAADWMTSGFDDSSWKRGESGFGTAGTPGAVIGTTWRTDDIWLRREIDLPVKNYDDLQAWVHHDEDIEVYINGVLAVKTGGYITHYEALPLTPQGAAALKPGQNLIAVHCHQTIGGQYVDFGLVDVQTK